MPPLSDEEIEQRIREEVKAAREILASDNHAVSAKLTHERLEKIEATLARAYPPPEPEAEPPDPNAPPPPPRKDDPSPSAADKPRKDWWPSGRLDESGSGE